MKAAPERFALCGLSMGGYIAFEVLRQAPERVTRLALLDTSAKPATPETNAPREQMIALAEKGAFDNVTTLLWQRLVAPARLADEPLRLLVRQMTMSGRTALSVSSARSCCGRTAVALASTSCPTLVVVGEAIITPVAEAREMAEIAGAHASLKVIPACGHLSTLEAPRP